MRVTRFIRDSIVQFLTVFEDNSSFVWLENRSADWSHSNYYNTVGVQGNISPYHIRSSKVNQFEMTFAKIRPCVSVVFFYKETISKVPSIGVYFYTLHLQWWRLINERNILDRAIKQQTNPSKRQTVDILISLILLLRLQCNS